jgi:hypothetical protein
VIKVARTSNSRKFHAFAITAASSYTLCAAKGRF